jgi:pimeloyl-ACP methyl ester carboxylesterase
MRTFVLIHGAGDVAWSWRLVAEELRRNGHVVVAPDLPDQAASLEEYADTVIDAIGQAKNLTVVGHSFGAFTAPLVAARSPTETLVLLAGVVPSPGEPPDDWWTNTGYKALARRSRNQTPASPASERNKTKRSNEKAGSRQREESSKK